MTMKKARTIPSQKSGIEYFGDGLLSAAGTLGSRVMIRGFLEKLGMKNPELWISILSELPAPLLTAIKKNAGKLEYLWTALLPVIFAEVPKLFPKGQGGALEKDGMRESPDVIGTISAALEFLLAMQILRRRKWLKRFHPAVLALTLAVPLVLRGLALAGRKNARHPEK
jgi:hypothetical protein